MENRIVAHDLSFQILLKEAAIRHRVQEMGRQISQRYQEQRPLFLAVLNGAFVFAADLIRACDIDCEISFIKLKSYQGRQSSGSLIEHIGLEESVKGRPVILVEDIIDSGHTMSGFLPRLWQEQPASVEIATLLFKPQALRYDLKIDYVGFSIEPRFVIGYGLDYDGLGRNLRDIYVQVD